MKLFPIIVIIFLLTGCVGVTVSRDEAINIDTKNSSFRLTEKSPPYVWNKEGHLTNGTQKVDSSHAWCGVIVWVIVPVPLMLPVCETYVEAAYVENTPVSITAHLKNYDLYACSPFMAVNRISNGYKGNFFCGTEAWR